MVGVIGKGFGDDVVPYLKGEPLLSTEYSGYLHIVAAVSELSREKPYQKIAHPAR